MNTLVCSVYQRRNTHDECIAKFLSGKDAENKVKDKGKKRKDVDGK